MVPIAPFARQGQAYFLALEFPQDSSSWSRNASFSSSCVTVSFVCGCVIDAAYIIKERMSSESAFRNFKQIIWEVFFCDVWLCLQISAYPKLSKALSSFLHL